MAAVRWIKYVVLTPMHPFAYPTQRFTVYSSLSESQPLQHLEPQTHLATTVIGTGVWLQSKTVPSEKELYSQLSPELKNKMDQIVRQREGSQTMKERLEEAGEKDQVVWGDQLNTKRKPLFPDRQL
ncbi:hypothetical protein D1P53_005191 [Cryptococcus gattii VGV]|nr:hypothetical protein D1P53_005191 [Cryptococcus gattii VGV]